MARKRLTPAHLTVRIRALQRRVRALDLDALLVTNDHDVRYLTGFGGEDSWALVRSRAPQLHLISDFRFQQQIQAEAPHVLAVMRKEMISQELAKLADRCRLERIGLQADHVTIAQRKAMGRVVGARRLVAVDDGLLKQRSIKNSREIAAIRRAVRISQQAFTNTLEQVKPGRTEQELAAHLEYQVRLLGGDGVGFPSIVAVDANASLPHAVPGTARVRRGGIVLFDWGAMFDGYCADLTRVVALGRIKPVLRSIYQIVLDAHDAAIAAIAPGKSFKQVDAVARDLITAAGYGKQFGHSLGHGIGLLIHETPSLSARSKGEFEPGQVLTVEPGIYLPGVGGIRIESDVLVTPRGSTVLSDLPTDLRSAII
jgi:Xaa-Pro aminopeptidase